MPALVIDSVTTQGRGPYSVRVKGGLCLGLSGPSGAGKSLLLRAITDLDEHEGRVALIDAAGEVDAMSISGPEWRRRIGYLPARVVWWFPTVGAHFDGFEIDERWLASMELERSALEWPIARLSSGESQRFALLRLLVRRPQALLLDEATAHLDPDRTLAVEELIGHYRSEHDAPVIWVTHDPEQLSRVAQSTAILGSAGLRFSSGPPGSAA
ncbi:MAG: ATP-binding cassette domain-containing protein [Planctomycetes bacterium]|nr:ATP-binding cassette domain-containing protein [Planctomycetota bacterium]